MTPSEFREAIDRLGLNQNAAAAFLRVGVRTVRRWAIGDADIPYPAVMVLKLMISLRLKPTAVERILTRE